MKSGHNYVYGCLINLSSIHFILNKELYLGEVILKGKFLKYNELEKHDSTPKAKGLIISFRSMGYTIETALADLIDNCIAASATKIQIYFDWTTQKIYIFDNGKGMGKEELIEAMDLASGDPVLLRQSSDLGRFGMGMKTASFSMGRNLLVVSKKDNLISNAFWDIDYVIQEGKWQTLSWDEKTIDVLIKSLPTSFEMCFEGSGTLIVISNLDKLIDNDNLEKSKKIFYETIENVKKHISLHFHRFIEEDNLEIYLNDNCIDPWNPFQVSNVATQELPVEEYNLHGKQVRIEPYILPHETKFISENDFENAGGSDWNRYQGFYVYRNRRLIEYGTWFRKLKKEPAYRLARIKLDITSESDLDWNIDILKSKVKLPSYLRDIVVRIASETSRLSVKIYNSRGTYTKKKKDNNNDLVYVWEQKKNSNGNYSFYLNKKHPLFKKLLENNSDENNAILKVYLKLVENYVPSMMPGIAPQFSEDKKDNISNDLKSIDIMEIKEYTANFRQVGIGDEEIIKLLKEMKQYVYLRNEIPDIVKGFENE